MGPEHVTLCTRNERLIDLSSDPVVVVVVMVLDCVIIT